MRNGNDPGNAAVSSPAAADDPVTEDWLAAETTRLLRFAEGARDPAGGFGRQRLGGGLVPGGPVELWVTGRMTHVFALGELLAHPGSAALVQHGLAALAPGGRLRDDRYGGWYAATSPTKTDHRKPFYQHCFVVLAAASAVLAGHPSAREVLADALDVVERRFWDDATGLPRESWDRAWTQTEAYRGANATMHGVEAFLAAHDAGAGRRWLDRALRMTERLVHGFARSGVPAGPGIAPETGPAIDAQTDPATEPEIDPAIDTAWRLPEHFDPDWHPLPAHNHDRPADPFRPYGATVGHGLEWSRLCLHLRAALGERAPGWLLDDARALFARAAADGWAVDGADGFIYTTDWDGTPVVRERMSWVAAEAVAAAGVLYRVTGEQGYRARERLWWQYIRGRVVDPGGAWHPELGPDGQPSGTVWADQPEVYHAVQATLLPRLPLRGSVAAALREAVRDVG